MKTFIYQFKTSVLFVFLFASMTLAQSSAFSWSIKGGGTAKDYGNALAVDSDGNLYVTGEFTGTAQFGSLSLVSAGNVDYYLVKYDSNHVAQWAKKGGGTLTDRGYGVTIDADGNVLVTGHFYGACVFDGVSLTGGGNLDVFTAKYSSSDGTIQWIKQGTSVSQLSSRAVAVDTAGNSIMVGYFGSTSAPTATFESTTLTSNGQRDAVIVKYDPSGNLLWAHNAGGINSGEEAKDVAVDIDGNSYVTGMFVDSASFDGTNVYSNGLADIFIAKYNKDGQILWVKNAGGPKADEGSTIAVDAAGNIYVGGRFDSLSVFDTDSILSAGKNDAFVAKYDPSGNLIWVKYGGGTDDDYCNEISLDNNGNLYGAGQFKLTATFGTTDIVSAGAEDVFMLKIDGAGDLQWVYRAGGIDIDRGLSSAVDNNSNFYTTGYFRATANFGDSSLTSAGLEDMFLSKIAHIIVPVELVSFSVSVDNRNVLLSWKTATELNNSGFEIQRSIDGVLFNRIGFVSGNGTTTQQNSYSYVDESPNNGINYYRLKQIDFDGSFEYSQVVESDLGLPSSFQISENFPNPFNPVTNVSITLPVESNVSLTLFNSLGEEVKSIVSNEYSAGSHILQISGSDLASGIYYYKIQINAKNGSTTVKNSKMVLIK